MRALCIEKLTPATYPFIDGLHATTHCSVYHDESLDAGLRTMGQRYFDLILVTHEQLPARASEIVGRIHSYAKDLLIRCPEVILLSEEPLPVQDALKCRDMQAMCMLREFPQPVYEEAKLAFWKRATRKHDLTLRIAFCSGHYDISLGIGSSFVSLELGSQLTKQVLILSGGNESYPVEFIADKLGICRQSVKKYMAELRRTSIVTQREVGIADPEKNAFWMERRPGGTVCGLKVNVVWA
jgi:hypothetical protein